VSAAPSTLGVVLAAGRGRRLGSITTDRSKAMLPVAGIPMVGRVLEMLSRGGCDRFIIVVHSSDQELAAYLAGSPWAAGLRTVDQAERLGMAHAVQCAGPLIRADGARDFVLASCDNVYPDGHVAQLVARRRSQDLDAAITLIQVTPAQIPTLAVVEIQNGFVRSIVEKPSPEDAPSDLGVPSLHALTPRILGCLSRVPVSVRGEREFPDALRILIEDGGRVGGQVVSKRLTLTRPPDLIALTDYFLRRDPQCASVSELPANGTQIFAPVRIERGARVGPQCSLGPVAVLESDCQVGAACVVRNSVVLRGASVEPGAVVEDCVVV
jgi:NDP-sugar pyrophosphorylase family protein